MRTFTHIKKASVGLTLGAVLALSAVVPAFADEVEFSQSVASGTLTSSISDAPTFGSPITYSHSESQNADDSVSISIDDSRGTGEGWQLSLVSTDLTYSGANPGGADLGASNVSLTSLGAPTSSAGQDATGLLAGDPGSLATDRAVLTAPAGTGEGVYSQTLQMRITIPAQTAAGTYTGTLTLTQAAAPID